MAKKSTQTQKFDTLHDLLILKLKALHYTEGELIKALPKMAKAASHTDLVQAFNTHLEETRMQKERLEKALKLCGHTGKASMESAAIDGLIEDAEWCVKNIKDPATLDAALIASAQSVEHFEMAGYGSARTWAEEMGHSEVAALLEETLEEESAANEKLTEIAESGVNDKANDMYEGETSEDDSLVDRAREAVQSAIR